MNNEQLKEITDRLDIIIKVLSVNFIEEDSPYMEKIKKLLSVGMSPAQIGRLLGKPTNFITVYTSKLKKENK